MLNMHNEMYASLMDVYLPGAALQAQLIADTKAHPAAQKKTTWCQQWMDSKASFGLRLVAFAAAQSGLSHSLSLPPPPPSLSVSVSLSVSL